MADPTYEVAAIIQDSDTDLRATVSFYDAGLIYVGLGSPSRDQHITMTLADFRRVVAAVEAKVA